MLGAIEVTRQSKRYGRRPAVDRVLDGPAGRLVLPVTDEPAILPEGATRLADNGLRVADLALRRPTPDDVLLRPSPCRPTTASYQVIRVQIATCSVAGSRI